MRWVEALKVWNAEHNAGKWCVPRKGSPEHAQVKAIMGKSDEGKKAEKKPPTREVEQPKPKMPSEADKAKIEEIKKSMAERKERIGKAKEAGERLEKATAQKRIAKALLARAMEKRAAKKATAPPPPPPPPKTEGAATKETAETIIRDWPNQKGIRTNREEYGKLIRALHAKGYSVFQIQKAIKEQIGGGASMIDDTSRGFWGHAKKEIEAAIAKKK